MNFTPLSCKINLEYDLRGKFIRMTDKILYLLTKNGYREMISRGEKNPYRIYYDCTSSVVNAVIFVDAADYTDEFMSKFKEGLTLGMGAKNMTAHFFLILFVDSSGSGYMEQLSVAHQVTASNPMSWIYDLATETLLVYETQASEFYGLRRLLENAAGVTEEELMSLRAPEPEEVVKLTPGEKAKKFLKEMPKVTAALVLVNIIVYIVCVFTGNLLYNKGGAGLSLMAGGGWYRVITSMFLHVNAIHLFGNMLLLYFTGDIVEHITGPLKFAVIYFASGITGCLVTFLSEYLSGQSVVIFGASGAVYGILGALLSLVIFKLVNRDHMKVQRVIFAIIISLYSGFTGTNVANWAHVGGLLMGFLAGILSSLIIKKNIQGSSDED